MHSSKGFCNFVTWARRSVRINFQLISLSLKNAICSCGYSTFIDIIYYNHCGLYHIFHYKIFVETFPYLLSRIRFQKLQSRNRIHAAFYIQQLHDVFHQHNFFKRIELLFQSPKPNHEVAESLETFWASISLESEAQLSNPL